MNALTTQAIPAEPVTQADWNVFQDDYEAIHAAWILSRMTGDRCRAIRCGKHYRIIRIDPGGKEVMQL